MGCEDCDALRLELETEKRRAKEASGRAALHLTEKHRAEEQRRATIDDGVRVAIRWLRAKPRTELVVGGLRIGHEVYRFVVDSCVRFLEERVATSERPTLPTLPRDDEDDDAP